MKSIFIVPLFLVMALMGQSQTIAKKTKKVQKYMVENAVIAHRGTIFWAPELTEAAFRWARNTGSDYLEMDVQRSKDGVLIVMHDRTFNRTTDVAQKFPGREKDFVDTFTWEEIMKLDAGSPFNKKNPAQARPSFVGQEVLVFEDVFRIAEGKKIKRKQDGSRVFYKDDNDQYVFEYEQDTPIRGHHPGVYIETKIPEQYPGMEEQIYQELARLGWNPLEGKKIYKKEPFYRNGKVNIGNTRGKILIQTFTRPGMMNFKRVFKQEVLTSFLVGNSKSNDFAKSEVRNELIHFAIESGAQFIGTNIGETNDGLTSQFSAEIHAADLKANAYSFNTDEQMEKYFGPLKGKKATPLLDGMITNRADLTTLFYHNREVRKIRSTQTPEEILKELGY